MYTPIISVEATTQVDHCLSVVQNLLTNVDTNNNKRHAISISEIMKEYTHQFDHALAVRVRVPLGHISLAAELLESLSGDKDLKMCLDVMTRSSVRISNLVTEFHSFHQAEEVKRERHTFH